jgi:flagellar protein FlgJ
MDVSAVQQQLSLAANQRESKIAEQMAGRASNISTMERAKIAELAEQFESIFMDTVFQSMRKTVPKSELFGGGNAEDIFRNMLDSEYAKLMSKGRSTGLADVIEKDLLKAMENRDSRSQQAEGQRVYARQSLLNEQKKETILQDQLDPKSLANP